MKNYWNSVLKHKQPQMTADLEAYLAICISEDLNKETAEALKTDILKRVLKFFVHRAQRQYLDHLLDKRQELEYEEKSQCDKVVSVNSFELKLLSRALSPNYFLRVGSRAAGCNPSTLLAIEQRQSLEKPDLQQILVSNESNEFFQVYLSN